jgi:hypothetical protein
MHQEKCMKWRGIWPVNQTAISGVQVLSGLRQSMPSSSIASCARVRQTVPSVACGQMNRPRSQALGKQAQTVSIEPEKFDHVTSTATKNEDMSGERLLFENRLHLCTQAVETTPQIRHTGSNPYPRSGAKLDHWSRLSRTERNSAGSAPLSTLIIATPGNSMWIAPPAVGRSFVPLACASIEASLDADTVTGSNAADVAMGSASSPLSKARRHLNTWFALECGKLPDRSAAKLVPSVSS